MKAGSSAVFAVMQAIATVFGGLPIEPQPARRKRGHAPNPAGAKIIRGFARSKFGRKVSWEKARKWWYQGIAP